MLKSDRWIRKMAMVPLDVCKFLSSFLNASITDAVGNKLRCSEKPANQTNAPLRFETRNSV